MGEAKAREYLGGVTQAGGRRAGTLPRGMRSGGTRRDGLLRPWFSALSALRSLEAKEVPSSTQELGSLRHESWSEVARGWRLLMARPLLLLIKSKDLYLSVCLSMNFIQIHIEVAITNFKKYTNKITPEVKFSNLRML